MYATAPDLNTRISPNAAPHKELQRVLPPEVGEVATADESCGEDAHFEDVRPSRHVSMPNQKYAGYQPCTWPHVSRQWDEPHPFPSRSASHSALRAHFPLQGFGQTLSLIASSFPSDVGDRSSTVSFARTASRNVSSTQSAIMDRHVSITDVVAHDFECLNCPEQDARIYHEGRCGRCYERNSRVSQC